MQSFQGEIRYNRRHWRRQHETMGTHLNTIRDREVFHIAAGNDLSGSIRVRRMVTSQRLIPLSCRALFSTAKRRVNIPRSMNAARSNRRFEGSYSEPDCMFPTRSSCEISFLVMSHPRVRPTVCNLPARVP